MYFIYVKCDTQFIQPNSLKIYIRRNVEHHFRKKLSQQCTNSVKKLKYTEVLNVCCYNYV